MWMALTLRRLGSETAAEHVLSSLVLWLCAEDISILEAGDIRKKHDLLYAAGIFSVFLSEQA